MSFPGARTSLDNLGWECMAPAYPHLSSCSLCRAFLLPSYQQVALTVLPSLSQGLCLVGEGTSLVNLALTTPMVGFQFPKTLECVKSLDSNLTRRIFVPSDRWFPALLKSLRSQRVIFVSCGEDHTAALTKLSYIFSDYLRCSCFMYFRPGNIFLKVRMTCKSTVVATFYFQ